MEKTEQIGKVTLDYSCYPGEDYYCDGAVEDELLEIVKNFSPAEYARIIEVKKSWPVLYHLSPLRENIVEWIPMAKDAKVLEVGSGCGAVTGVLSRKAGTVTCVDLSQKRSRINAHRHSDCDNVTIHVGNFKDIEPGLDQDYDFIFLIGVFEYGQSYIGGGAPYEEFLRILSRHLGENGRIIVAIENKYGLKYFAGCKEDHLGSYFSGIENYAAKAGVRTFGRKGLERIFHSCGFRNIHFYYPYPDYKFMTTIYSDDYLPGRGELSNNYRNFDRDRMLLFDEKNAFDGIVEEELFSVFSNSYLAVLGEDFPVKYVKYSNDRADEYVIKTQINRESPPAVPQVYKVPLTQEAQKHIRGLAVAYENLLERYQGGRLEINRCELEEEDGQVRARFEFVNGIPLSELMDACLDQGDADGFHRYFREYVERISYHSDFPVADFDLVFSNILVSGEKWTLIDYEWTFGKPVETKELAFRAVYCYLLEDESRNRLELDRILEELGITQQEAQAYRKQEMDFQKFVTGKKRSMAELREMIGYRMITPQKWIEKFKDSEGCNRVQIYEDRGSGYSEENSYFAEDAYQEENLVEMELRVSGDVRQLRIDPSMDSCMVRFLELSFNGEAVPLRGRKLMTVNGRTAWPEQKEKKLPSIVFPTADPNISLRLEALDRRAENVLYVKMEVVRLPLAMAQDMAGAVKRFL